MGDPARVTDDTQMALAVGRALIAAAGDGALSPARLQGPLTAELVAWLRSPDNNRAPGGTCLHATRRLAAGIAWPEATVAGSKGCGANMRVAPVGLLPRSWAGAGDTRRGRPIPGGLHAWPPHRVGGQ